MWKVAVAWPSHVCPSQDGALEAFGLSEQLSALVAKPKPRASTPLGGVPRRSSSVALGKPKEPGADFCFFSSVLCNPSLTPEVCEAGHPLQCLCVVTLTCCLYAADLGSIVHEFGLASPSAAVRRDVVLMVQWLYVRSSAPMRESIFDGMCDLAHALPRYGANGYVWSENWGESSRSR
jgi:hypothetical protein